MTPQSTATADGLGWNNLQTFSEKVMTPEGAGMVIDSNKLCCASFFYINQNL